MLEGSFRTLDLCFQLDFLAGAAMSCGCPDEAYHRPEVQRARWEPLPGSMGASASCAGPQDRHPGHASPKHPIIMA